MQRHPHSLTQRLTLFLCAAMIAMIGACATKPVTFRDKVAAASVTVQFATKAGTQLAAEGKITKAQAQGLLETSRAASLSLDTAEKLNAAGDLPAATAQLAMADAVLNAAKDFLLNYGVKQP